LSSQLSEYNNVYNFYKVHCCSQNLELKCKLLSHWKCSIHYSVITSFVVLKWLMQTNWDKRE